MKKPNFFIIGAPKCGTTSLAHYLSEHPLIYMSEVKEPFYFSDDININVAEIYSLDEYEKLFLQANSHHIAVGEASTQYLYSQNAVDNILRYNFDAKFIVMLRNPVEMAYSLHTQQVFSLHEDVEDFEAAWKLQEERRKGGKIPSDCKDPQVLMYGDWCKLDRQVKQLLEKVDKKKVSIILLDDLKRDPREIYRRVLSFLGVPDDDRTEFPKLNESKRVRSKKLQCLITLLGKVKRALGIYKPLYISRLLNNQKKFKREPLSEKMRQELQKYFKEDIKLLEETIHRDLSIWLGPDKNNKKYNPG